MSTETCMTGRGRKLRQEVGDDGSREVFICTTRTADGIEKQSVDGKVARMAHCAVPNGVAD